MSTGNDNKYSENGPLFRTTVRKNVTPFLPPPVIKAINEIDLRLEPIVGPEASMTVAGNLLFAWFLLQLVQFFFRSGSSSGDRGKTTAIHEDDRDQDILPSDAKSSRPFDETVLLCGPSLAGKTCIFYGLLQKGSSDGDADIKMATVRSIKSNTGFLQNSETVVRILDTPGHWGPEKLLRVVKLPEVQRVVVVVDSSQPIIPAADYLYAILKSTITNSTSIASPIVLIACHKSDHTKAKNGRRIKLQLRSELIRLGKLDAVGENENNNNEIDWEEAMNAVPLCSSTISNLKPLQEFCESGTLPSTSTKR